MYYFGIVDFLQDWTFNKRVERSAKIYFLRKDPAGLSVMEPVAYKLRFQKKMRQIFDLDHSRQAASPSSSTPTVRSPATALGAASQRQESNRQRSSQVSQVASTSAGVGANESQPAPPQTDPEQAAEEEVDDVEL